MTAPPPGTRRSDRASVLATHGGGGEQSEVSSVLVVDDEPAILRAMDVNLRVRGYEVAVATTGTQALALAARRHPDVIVLDLGLPDMDGIDVIRGLRGWSSVPIVVLSARTAEAQK